MVCVYNTQLEEKGAQGLALYKNSTHLNTRSHLTKTENQTNFLIDLGFTVSINIDI